MIRQFKDALRGWPRAVWVVPGVVFLLLALGSLGPGTFFLHEDTPTQHTAAVDLLRGCWGYSAATLAPMVLLAVPFAIFGPHPAGEMAILTLLGAAMAVAFFRLVARLGGSRRWALLGALWFISLPTVLYYTRMHIGYPLAFFTLGVMLHAKRRYTWAGVMLGLAFTSHFNYTIPVAAWLGWTFLLDRETRRPAALAQLAVGVLAPLVALELARFLFTGIPFGWLREEIEDALRLSRGSEGLASWPVTHLLRLIGFSNGWGSFALIVAGLTYPLVRRPRVPLMDAVFLAGWSLLVFYSLRVSVMHNTFMTPRMFSGAYPLLAAAAAFTIMRLAQRVAAWPRLPARGLLRAAGAALVAVALPVVMLSHTLDALAGTRTAYLVANQVIAEARHRSLPVRVFGVYNAAIAFAVRNEAVVAVNETLPGVVAGDRQAVLIFEGEDHPVLAALLADPHIDPADYTITHTPHRLPYRPASVERYGASPAYLRHLQAQPFVRDPRAEASGLIVWWPREPQGTFSARHVPDEYIFLYEGGCVIPKRFEVDHSRNYYDLLWEKTVAVAQQLAAGDLRDAVRQVRDWIEN